MAHKEFSQLLQEQKEAAVEAKNAMKRTARESSTGFRDKKTQMRRFVGRDRRLYYNKALCEL